MKTAMQLLRQPLKTIAGMLLMTLAAAILCLCVGQAIAAQTTKANLDSRFSTTAVLSIQEDVEGLNVITVEQELIDWVEKMAQEHPDIVKGVTRHGILSAAIPELLPYNPLREPVADYTWTSGSVTTTNPTGPTANFRGYTSSDNYDSAMLVITLEEIGQVREPAYWPEDMQQPRESDYETKEEYVQAVIAYEAYQAEMSYMYLLWDRGNGYSVELVGTVEQVISLQDGLRDPVGMTARLTVILPSEEEIQALGLEVGQQYIVYGMDYNDDYRSLITFMESAYSGYDHISFEPFDPSLLKEPTLQERQSFALNKHIYVEKMYNSVPLQPWQYKSLNSVSMTLLLPSNLVGYGCWQDENGRFTNWQPKEMIECHDNQGNTVQMSAEEYNNLYAVPTIARVDGSVEDFLNSDDGAAWRAALERDEINNHAFTVIGVEDLDAMATFALGKSTLGEGREFTAEEVQTGARVCIVHEKVAQINGLQLGDTVSLSFFATEHGQPYALTRADEAGLLCPAPSLYTTTSSILETVEYTVVGFWQGETNPDARENYYSFDANTVFVPQSSVSVPMEQCDTVPFVSCKLENGMIDQFHKLAQASGYAGRFKYCDQDYSKIAVNFHNYSELAEQILTVGMVLYGILLLLFVLLFPGMQKKQLRTMESIGCAFGRRFGYVLASAFSIVVPASLLGGLLGVVLWDRVATALQASAESTVELLLEPAVLAQVAAVQLALVLVLNILIAVVVAAPRGMASRR